MIRKMKPEEIDQVGEIWLQSNLEVHDFVDKKYWISNLSEVKEQFTQADIFVYVDGTIKGFAGLQGNYIAGIFVNKIDRGQGIGKQLLNYLKENYDKLILDVYEKNTRARKFYADNDFQVSFEDIDSDNDEKEYQLLWQQ